MAKGERARGFLNNIAASAVWDSFKKWGLPFVTSLLAAIWEYLRHRTVDWWGIVGLFGITCLVVWLGRTRNPTPDLARPVAFANTSLIGNKSRSKVDPGDSHEAERNELFSSDQMEAFRLASEIRGLMDEAGKNPGAIMTREDARSFDAIWEAGKVEDAWRIKFTGLYRARLRDRVAIVASAFCEQPGAARLLNV